MSATHRLLRFGLFELNLDTEELRKEGISLKLGPQPLKVLAILAGRSGQIVTREEVRQEVWGEETYVDFEHGLNQCIKQIRTALNDNSSKPLYIETLPRKGYRFLAPVTSKAIAVVPKVTASSSGIQPRVSSSNDAPITGMVVPAGEIVGLATRAIPAVAATEQREPLAIAEAASTEKAPQLALESRYPRGLIGWLALVVIAAAALGFYFYRSHHTRRLSERDTIVVAEFVNRTGDAVFDETLKTALTVALNQSPFLNVLSDKKVAQTLKLMTRPGDTKLTPEVVQELCQRANSTAYIAGSISSLGSEYVLGLKAVNCENGETLAEKQVRAASKEKVLDALGSAASRLRSELGESLATLQKYDVPLPMATTSSLEALQALSFGRKAGREKGSAAALPYDQRAVELDPNFAMGYQAIGLEYWALGELERASQNFSKAFRLRERTSEREKLRITADYYQNVTGELDKATQTSLEMVDTYPQEPAGYVKLEVAYGLQGQWEKSMEMIKEALRLAPDELGLYEDLANSALALQRFDDARHIFREAQARKADRFILRCAEYALGFLDGDSAAMAEQQRWFANKPEYESSGLALASDTEAYGGHLWKARELTKRAVDSAIRNDSKENAGVWQSNAAVREAAYGNSTEARQSARAALRLAPTSLGVGVETALAFAMAGDTTVAESSAQDLDKRYPLDTQVQSLWLSTIRAQLALNQKNPMAALNALEAATPIELGALQFCANLSCLYAVYIRGEAYLAAGQGKEAAAEFQKVLDHTGLVWNCWTGALAHLGVARANVMQAKSSQGTEADGAHARAIAAYNEFLTLWKDADPDIPIYKQAKAEYAALIQR